LPWRDVDVEAADPGQPGWAAGRGFAGDRELLHAAGERDLDGVWPELQRFGDR
jgi:hypothetical protein